MLNFESRMEILGVTVFQDADTPEQYYYLPGPPHLSIEGGVPQFELYSYRGGGGSDDDLLTGGFLNMTVDLSLGSLFDRVKNRLEDQVGREVTLSSVPFTDGSVRVVALGEDSEALQGGVEEEVTPGGDPLVARGPRFIEEIIGAGTPSLDGDNRAIFSFSLNEDGAAFFMDVLGGSPDARPVGVIYDLNYIGLVPAYDLKITIDFESSYSYLRDRFTLGTLLFKADIDNIVEELERREAIRIEETARTLDLSDPEAVRERQNHIDQLVKDLATGALFHPALTPGQPKVQDDTITAADPTSSVPTGSPESSSAAGRALRHGPTAAVAAGMGESLGGETESSAPESGGGRSGGTSSDGGRAPAGRSGDAQTPSEHRSAAEIWNDLGRPQAAYAVKQISQEERRRVTYDLSQVTAEERRIAPQNFIRFLADPRLLNRNVHAVDLNQPFFEQIDIDVSAADMDFQAEGVAQITVQLRYGTRRDGTFPKDTADVILRSSSDTHPVTFFMDQARTHSYEYKLIVDYRSDFGIGVDETRIEGSWTPSEARTLVVHSDWLSHVVPVTVQLAPNVSEDISEAHCRVHYVNEEHGVDDSRLVVLDAGHRAETVPIRSVDDKPAYQVSTTLFYSDGAQEVLPIRNLPDPAAPASGHTVVISPPRSDRLNADAIMLDPLGELSSVLVDTKVSQDEDVIDARTLELSGAGERAVWSVRLPNRNRPTRLDYRERRVFTDGGLEEAAWRQAASPNLVVGVPAEGTLSVTVTYIGPKPSALGIMAIMVDLSYEDPKGDPEFEQAASLLVTDDPSTHVQDWKVRLPDRQARTYTSRLTLFHADGGETRTESKSRTGAQLLLRVPAL